MLRWFTAIMPKEEKFFDLFARHSEVVVAGAEALRALLEGGEKLPIHYRTVMEREHDAADEGNGGYHRDLRRTGAGSGAAVAPYRLGSAAREFVVRAHFAARRPGRRTARCRAEEALSAARAGRPHGVLRRQRSVRPSGEGGRPLRRRRE